MTETVRASQVRVGDTLVLASGTRQTVIRRETLVERGRSCVRLSCQTVPHGMTWCVTRRLDDPVTIVARRSHRGIAAVQRRLRRVGPMSWVEVRADQVRRGDTIRRRGRVRKTQMKGTVLGSSAGGDLRLGPPTWTRLYFEGSERHFDCPHDARFQIRDRGEAHRPLTRRNPFGGFLSRISPRKVFGGLPAGLHCFSKKSETICNLGLQWVVGGAKVIGIASRRGRRQSHRRQK